MTALRIAVGLMLVVNLALIVFVVLESRARRRRSRRNRTLYRQWQEGTEREQARAYLDNGESRPIEAQDLRQLAGPGRHGLAIGLAWREARRARKGRERPDGRRRWGRRHPPPEPQTGGPYVPRPRP